MCWCIPLLPSAPIFLPPHAILHASPSPRPAGPIRVLSDAETAAFFRERAQRLRLECCVCGEYGWEEQRGAGVPRDARRMFLPTCADPEHAVCAPCTLRLASAASVTPLSTRVCCPYPHAMRGASCRGVVPRRHWAPMLATHAPEHSPLQSCSTWHMRCTGCGHGATAVEDPSAPWSCDACGRAACGACDEVVCVCRAGSRPSRGYSRCFSRSDAAAALSAVASTAAAAASGGDSPVHAAAPSCMLLVPPLPAADACMPLRRHEVTPTMVAVRLKALQAHAPSVHTACPTCAAPLFKSSACNALRHCGPVEVCNWCQERSWPWEDGGLDRGHWVACPRWDHDVAGHPCREGQCCSAAWGGECRDPSHAPAVAAMHRARWEAAVRALAADVGPAVFSHALLELQGAA